MLHRQILSQADLTAFLESTAFNQITSFIDSLNDSVKGCKNSSVNEAPESFLLIDWCCGLIAEASQAIDSFPPQDRQAEVNRFGSPAFRHWMYHVQSVILPRKCEELKGTFDNAGLIEEAQQYFSNAMGSSERIDYGTGHELHFLIFMLCIQQLHQSGKNAAPISPNQLSAFNRQLVLKVFLAYIRLMAHLQRLYWLEPAGSHGVWGLDDYHFLPFLFGAAQLVGNTQVRPKSINAPPMVEWLAAEYVYFEMIDRILKVKRAIDSATSEACPVDTSSAEHSSLRWLSPVLDDISAVKTWEKVNSGLVKMYRVEVLGKLPIMQHCLFGNHALSFSGGRRAENDVVTEDGNKNNIQQQQQQQHYKHSQRGDCCGNPLPSIYSASSASQPPLRNKQPGLPFD